MNINKISIVIFIITVGPGVLGILESFTVQGEARSISKIIGILMITVGLFAWMIIMAILKTVNYFISKNK